MFFWQVSPDSYVASGSLGISIFLFGGVLEERGVEQRVVGFSSGLPTLFQGKGRAFK